MAHSATGGWVGGDDWYAWLDVSKANPSDTVTRVTVVGGIYNAYANASYFTADITSDASGGTSNYAVGSLSTGSGSKTIKTNTIDVARGTSEKTLSVMCKVNGSGGYAGSSSTAQTTVKIPAKTSYNVSYDANGGTGAPSDQTKWYGDALTLSSTHPTRTGYSFTGWNTAADGTGTSYASGASYTANAALALYAQWSLDYALPTISGLTVIRCLNTSGYPASEEGTYAKVSFGWALDSSATGGSYIVEYRTAGSSGSYSTAKASTAVSGTGGTVSGVLLTPTFGVQSGYDIKVTVTDNGGYSQSVSTVLTQGFAHIVLGGPDHPHSVGIGKTPTASNTLDIGLDTSFDGAVAFASGAVTTLLDNSTITVEVFGRMVMVQLYGITATPGTSTVLASGTLASYLPSYNISALVSDASGSARLARLWVDASNGNICLAAVGYTSSSTWYGTLTYIY